MSRVCEVTGKSVAVGNRVSHANNKKRRRFLPNLHTQRFWLEGERRWVSLRISTSGLRTIEKNGIESVIAGMRSTASTLLKATCGATSRLVSQKPMRVAWQIVGHRAVVA